MTPDLERLRRFGLIVALVLISCAAAGVELDREAKFSLLGLPFIVRRPDLILLGLILASVYASVRFIYYGVMLMHSPQRRRADMFHQLHGYGGYGTRTGSIFFGPAKYETTPLTNDRDAVEKQLRQIVDAFPKVWKFRAKGHIEAQQFADDGGELHAAYSAQITIPFACRTAAFIEDIDYTMPIWLNMLALALSIATHWPSRP
ncbi:MAG: hypothetical protein HY017_17525 [Betaproteobacteria bacterium]|nr:hypothetical protein [Betaproteobacteria bacterium]